MQKGKDLIQQTVQEIEQSPKTSPTEAGQPDKISPLHIDTINQVFTLFRLNYHNQYYSAYPGAEELNQNKKLWSESLSRFTSEQILRAARQAIEECEYLPNLHRMIELCRNQGPGGNLPGTRDAYLEACNAPSPKAVYNWSHPAVYHAGQQCGWYLLSNEAEKIAFPIFEKKYRDVCAQVLAGEKLTIDALPLLEEKDAPPLTAKQNQKKVKALKKSLNLL